MFSTLLSFLGGSVFRMLWGEVSSWVTARQDHKHEVERMRLQGELDAAQHGRNLEAIRVQAELGVKTIQVQAEADIGRIDAEAFSKAVEGTSKPTGITWVDAWNGLIRPLLATECMLLVSLHFHSKGWVLDDRGWELAGAALGIFVADRVLFRRGK